MNKLSPNPLFQTTRHLVNQRGKVRETVAVGLDFGDGSLNWGVCLPVDRPLETLEQLVDEIIAPAAAGWSLQSWPEFCRLLQTVRGQAGADGHQKRPLPGELLFALETAALKYFLSRGRPLTDSRPVQNTPLLPHDPASVPFAATADMLTDPILLSGAAAILAPISGENPAATLGEDGRRLQRYVRDLAAWIKSSAPDTEKRAFTGILLDLRGVLGLLYENNLGQILGSIHGLEQAAQPFQLTLIDPLLPGRDPDATQQLKEYMRFRKMSSRLMVRAEAEPNKPLTPPEGVDGLVIDLKQGVWTAGQQITQLQAAGIEAILDVGDLPAELVDPLWETPAVQLSRLVLLPAGQETVLKALNWNRRA